MWTSLVIIPSLVLGELSLDLLHEPALEEGRHPVYGALTLPFRFACNSV
jgi:hypothetical protein